MKQVTIFYIVFFLSTSLLGQSIVQKNHEFGVINSDGTILLPIAYDSIYSPSKFWHESSILIAKSEGKFGLINTSNNWFTGLLFDEIHVNDDVGLLQLRTGTKWGFMSLTSNYNSIKHTSTIFPLVYCAPKYEYVGISWTANNKELSVKDHQQFGLLDFYSGDTLVPIRFKHPLTAHRSTTGALIYKSSDRKGIDPDTIVNPRTNATISVDHDSEVMMLFNDSLLFVLTEFLNDYNGALVIYNYNNGDKLLDYHFQRDYIRFEDYNFVYERLGSNYILVSFTFKPKGKRKYVHQISCFQLQTNYRVFYYEGSKFDRLLPIYDQNEALIYLTDMHETIRSKQCVGKLSSNNVINWFRMSY
jgi:hypothetical protein